MGTERRYNEEEIARIFKQATADQESADKKEGTGEGLTLDEIAEIGKEAGINPALIANAAATIDHEPSVLPATKTLGFTVSVGRSAKLPAPFSDKDWDMLVDDLERTLGVSGDVHQNGTLREWSSINVKCVVEPHGAGYQLVLHALNDNARSGLKGGLFILLTGLFLTVLLGSSSMDWQTMIVLMFAAVGIWGFGRAAYRLPGWRAEQARNLDEIAKRAVSRMGAHAALSSEKISSPTLDLETREGEESDLAHKVRPKSRSSN